MSGMVEDLLLLARLDAGRPLAYESTDLSPLVVDAVSPWAAAAIGAQNAASYQLATGDPVMAIGGFNGSDPSPTLARFKEYAEAGRIHYFISGGGGGGGGNSGTSASITAWVEDTFTEVAVGSTTFYDLTRPKSGA